MKLYRLLVIALVALSIVGFSLSALAAPNGLVTGVVFDDVNVNGALDPDELGLENVTVTAYDSAGAVAGTATTGIGGIYSIGATGSGPYRIEFTNFPVGYFDSLHGTHNGSSLQAGRPMSISG